MKEIIDEKEYFRDLGLDGGFPLYGCMSYSSVLLLAIAVIVILFLTGCGTTQYVPVETVKTVYQTRTDTVREKDSVVRERETIIREARPEDSLLLASMGIRLQKNERLLILLRKELETAREGIYESHTDTVIKTDSIQVPYPVEKKLTRWQSFCCDYGKVMIGMTAGSVVVCLLLLWMRRRYKRS